MADRVTINEQYKLLFTRPIPTRPLADILDEYLPANQTIDFLTVDVEGLDLAVLRSNNWQKYRPVVILTETIHISPGIRVAILKEPRVSGALLDSQDPVLLRDDFRW